MIDLQTPPDRPVKWIVWKVGDQRDPVGVDAQSWFEACRKAAVVFGCGPEEIRAVLA